MAERDVIEQLDRAVDAMFAGARIASGLEETPLGELVRIATGLCDLPEEAFRERLKSELTGEGSKSMTPAKTATSYIREGFRTVTPYLHVQDADRFIEFVKKAFGAQERFRVNLPDGKIMHAEVTIGDSIVELADAGPRPVALHLYVQDADAVYQRAVAAGASPVKPPVDQPYGDREACVRDASGNNWYVATHQGAAHVPAGLRSVTPYLHPEGTSEFIDFLKRAFGAVEMERYASPDGVVQHAKIGIGDAVIEMGEAHGEWQPMPAALHIYVEDADALYRRAVAAGATSISAPEDKPYGDRTAEVSDRQGNRWYIATHIRDVAM